MQISISAPSIKGLSRQYAQAPRVIQQELKSGMTRSVFFVERDAKREVKHDTANLRRSITSEVDFVGRDVRGRVGTNLPHGKPVEEGRRAGAPMPPAGVLVASGWMRRHGIPDHLEYVIRRAISVNGIKPAPYLIPALEKNIGKIRHELGTKVAQRVIARLTRH